MHHRNPIKDFYYFFFRKETLLTLLNEYTKFFPILFFSFSAEIPYGKDHYRTFLHLTVVKILVQLTLLISKTGFGVWVLDWSVRHILFCTWITGLFHYHYINNGSCHAIWAYQNGSNHMWWPFLSNVNTLQQREIILPIPPQSVCALSWIPNGSTPSVKEA